MAVATTKKAPLARGTGGAEFYSLFVIGRASYCAALGIITVRAVQLAKRGVARLDEIRNRKNEVGVGVEIVACVV